MLLITPLHHILTLVTVMGSTMFLLLDPPPPTNRRFPSYSHSSVIETTFSFWFFLPFHSLCLTEYQNTGSKRVQKESRIFFRGMMWLFMQFLWCLCHIGMLVPASFCLVSFLSISNNKYSIIFNYINWKSVNVVLGIWTHGRTIVGADRSNVLWRPPFYDVVAATVVYDVVVVTVTVDVIVIVCVFCHIGMLV